MKKLAKIVAISCLCFMVACSGKTKQDEATNTESADWKEMDSFHMIMAEAFHPYKDSSNLEPAKKLAEEMALEAEKWSAASLPSKVDNQEVKASLEKLKVDTRALADLIKSGADDQSVGTALNALHDSFHGIMEAWHGGGEKHKHQH
jgi:hypothetical protein